MKAYLAALTPYGGEVIYNEYMNLHLAGTCSRQFLFDDNNMKTYLALANAGSQYQRDAGKLDNRLCILESFYYVADWMLPYIQDKWDFLLDSGAFTFMNDKKNANGVNWESYIDKYADFVIENKVENFFELDIDVVVWLPEVRKLRKRLEQRTGRRSIPVWHKSRGLDNWKAITKDYDYVAIGGIVTQEIKRTERGIFRPLCAIANQNGAKVHGLGFTPLDGSLGSYGFHSTDSTSWIQGNRGGFLYVFDGRKMQKINKPEGTRMKGRAIAVHNFTEWVKFQNYMKEQL